MGSAGCGGLWEHSSILKYQRQQLAQFCWKVLVLVGIASPGCAQPLRFGKWALRYLSQEENTNAVVLAT